MRRVAEKRAPDTDGRESDAADEHGRIYLTLLFNKYRGLWYAYLSLHGIPQGKFCLSNHQV